MSQQAEFIRGALATKGLEGTIVPDGPANEKFVTVQVDGAPSLVLNALRGVVEGRGVEEPKRRILGERYVMPFFRVVGDPQTGSVTFEDLRYDLPV